MNAIVRAVAGCVVLLLALAVSMPAQESTPAQESALTAPWVETRAPGVFGEARSTAAREWTVAYQVDATIRLPLLIARIPIVSRDNVGVTSFSARDFTADPGNRIRAYEFFAASFPERASAFCARRCLSTPAGWPRPSSSG